MAEPGLYVVKKRGLMRAYKSWRGGFYVPFDLFAGPSFVTDYVESTAQCLSKVWNPYGGAIIDFDSHSLAFFGSALQFDIPAREFFLKLLRHKWQDWNLQWANSDIEILSQWISISELHDPEEPWPMDSGYTANYVVTRVDKKNSLSFYPVLYGEELVFHGEERCFEILNKFKSFPKYPFAGNSFAQFPIGGMVLNEKERQLSLWSAEYCYDLEANLESLWPGWRVQDAKDKYQLQLSMSKSLLHFPHRSDQELLKIINACIEDRGYETRNPPPLLSTKKLKKEIRKAHQKPGALLQ